MPLSAPIRFLCALLATVSVFAQSDLIEVGSQSPNGFVYSRFLGAYTRNGFNALVSLPPLTHVQKAGPGLVQLFPDPVGTSGVRFALMKADANANLTYDESGQISGGDVYQVYAPVYSYLASVNGVSASAPANLNVTGFPRGDTQSTTCGNAACNYQYFEKNYALFYRSFGADGTPPGELQVQGGFFTQWFAGGGISSYGAPLTNEAAITSAITGAKAEFQRYVDAHLFRLNGGTATERYLLVRNPVSDYYAELGGPTGSLGLPIEILRTMPDGKFRQSFEGGTVEYKTGERPILLLPVQRVLIEGVTTTGTIKLRRGESIEVRVRLVDSFGNELTGRTVSWLTSNSRIVSVEVSGARATLRAIGAGLATVTALSEGRRSTPLTISVASQCCEAGEGAPNPIVSQAVQETIRRNRLNVRIPTGAPVQRMGGGYYQEFQDAANAAPYLIAVPDPGSTGFLVKGETLGRFLGLGGLTGVLGYPSSEESAGGRQIFSSRYALAGRPVHVVQSPLLERWALSGYEAGPLGLPTSETTQLMTFAGSAGVSQSFSSGLLAASTADQRAYAVVASLAARYLSLDGPAGELGLPVSEQVVVDGVRRQSFEGGTLSQAEGEDVAANLVPRKPRVLITPNPVTAGSRVRIAAGGFPSGASVRITAGSEPAFEATAVNGAFAWVLPVATSAPAATVRVVALGPEELQAEGSYRVRSLAEADPRLAKLAGDLQTGPPGALLPLALRVALRDSTGAPLEGVAVTFQPAPGTVLEKADSVTDSAGEAHAWLRLPESEGVALATATAARQVVTFSARATNTILSSFPSLTQELSQTLGASTAPIKEQGALLAAAANILRFYQDRGLLPAPNGLADPLSLNLFLKDYCAFATPEGAQVCDGFFPLAGGEYAAVNLARAPAFAGAGAVFEFGAPKFETIRDWLAEGDPVLIAMSMTADSLPAGMHYIVARGIAANGGVLTFDSSGFFGRSSLNDFLTDFSAGGRAWRGNLVSVARLQRRPPGPNSFYVRATAAFDVVAEQGACPAAQPWLDRPATLSSIKPPAPWWFAICDAQAAEYQLNVNAAAPFRLDAASGGLQAGAVSLSGQGPAAYRMSTGSPWRLAPQAVELDPELPPLNAANLLPQLAPGSLMSIFGSGLLAPDGRVSIEVAGFPLPPAGQSPFRLTTWLPPSLAPGRHPARIVNSLGQAEFAVEILEAAPAVFQDSNGRPLITDMSGRTITQLEPARRGAEILVYATGLGDLSGAQATNPVSAEIDNRPAEIVSVNWVPDQAGVYQIRLRVPEAQAPGESAVLTLKQLAATAAPVRISIR